jgi:hypothetical protein
MLFPESLRNPFRRVVFSQAVYSHASRMLGAEGRGGGRHSQPFSRIHMTASGKTRPSTLTFPRRFGKRRIILSRRFRVIFTGQVYFISLVRTLPWRFLMASKTNGFMAQGVEIYARGFHSEGAGDASA